MAVTYEPLMPLEVGFEVTFESSIGDTHTGVVEGFGDRGAQLRTADGALWEQPVSQYDRVWMCTEVPAE
jgi:hypothetical protein